MITIRYFARLREALGVDTETLEMPEQATVAGVVEQLRQRGGEWQALFAEDQLVMMAVDQEMGGLDSAIADGCEVAFFPPVTGG